MFNRMLDALMVSNSVVENVILSGCFQDSNRC